MNSSKLPRTLDGKPGGSAACVFSMSGGGVIGCISMRATTSEMKHAANTTVRELVLKFIELLKYYINRHKDKIRNNNKI